MRVLLIEDDKTTSDGIKLMLSKEGFNTESTDDGEDGVDLAKVYEYDIILLDLNLPGINGFEVLKRVRAAKVKTPVLILSGMKEPDKKVKGLMEGADDYLTKPFDRSELVARIQAIVRRSQGYSESVIRTGRLEVNLSNKTAYVDGKPLHLTGTEYDILELLSRRKGSKITKSQFLTHIYNEMDDEPEIKIIDVFICKLRKKIKDATGGENYIETVWGRGYALQDPAEQKQ